MTPLVVVAPTQIAPGFSLGGATTLPAQTGAETVERVGEALAAGAVVIAVHAELWTAVPVSVRRRWEQASTHLVIALPPDDGAPTQHRDAELHELLASAVGYEISFTTGGPS